MTVSDPEIKALDSKVQRDAVCCAAGSGCTGLGRKPHKRRLDFALRKCRDQPATNVFVLYEL